MKSLFLSFFIFPLMSLAQGYPTVLYLGPHRSAPASLQNTDCSAVVLSEKVLLTAGHCVEKTNYRYQKKLFFAVNDDQSVSASLSFQKIVFHPKYKIGFVDSPNAKDSAYDMAIIILDSSLKRIKNDLKFAELADSYERDTVFVSQKKQVVSELFEPDSEKYLLARSKDTGVSACQGDSGGGYFSILAPSKLIAIQSVKSSQYPCGHKDLLAGASSVIDNRDWILNVSGL